MLVLISIIIILMSLINGIWITNLISVILVFN